MFTLTIYRHGKLTEMVFNSITDAYSHYVKHYATLQEWFYYLNVAHKLLCDVHDEHTMECMFTHVFRDGCIVPYRG